MRAAALTQDARERREVLQRFSRRAEDLTAITQQLQDRCDRAERRADVADGERRARGDGRAPTRCRSRATRALRGPPPGRAWRLPSGPPAAGSGTGHV